MVFSLLAALLMLNLAGSGEVATLPESAGPRPTLPPPPPTLLATAHVAPAGNVIWRVTPAAT